MTRPSLNHVRREANILYHDLAKKLPGVKVRRMSKFLRGQTHYGAWNWLVEAAVCEVMREISNLQTDLEDFCGSPQRQEVPAKTEVRSV